VVINNGIDQKKFDPSRNFNNIRQELGIAPDAVLVLFVARFIHQKQPLKLIEAFAQAQQQNPKLQLLMVGDGDQKPTALQLVKDLNIENKVIFQPFRQDVPDVLAAADIFVLPSLWEGLPIGLLEAMSMGKAIIGTQVDGTSEVIRHNENGLLIPTDGLTDNLSAAILKIAADKDLRHRLGSAAQQTISSTYSASNMTREIEAIYIRLLNGDRKGI
jgi:glycosyltransferase involved in cell wall biosynthesis